MFEITADEQRRLVGMSGGALSAGAGAAGAGRNVSSLRFQSGSLLASSH
jgi:hypothetical protein